MDSFLTLNFSSSHMGFYANILGISKDSCQFPQRKLKLQSNTLYSQNSSPQIIDRSKDRPIPNLVSLLYSERCRSWNASLKSVMQFLETDIRNGSGKLPTNTSNPNQKPSTASQILINKLKIPY